MQKWVKRLALLCIIILFICCHFITLTNQNVQDKKTKMEDATTTPFGKYPEMITYKLGKMTGANNSNMPVGDTYENNAYTRYLKEKLNIQNDDEFEADTDYDNIVSMAITSENLPDIMVVSTIDQLQTLVDNDLIEDLSEVYENCASDKIKEIYGSYGDAILENVTFNGKLMAIPETNIENGPSMLWLRKDWMDKLGLYSPKTIDDVEYIITQFLKKNPANSPDDSMVGIVADKNLTGQWGYSYEYQTDIIFASYQAYPKRWIYNDKGEVVYGSIQPEAKKGIQRLRNMYESGILDNKFLLRTQENIVELIRKGKCGSFFGPWWAPNNPLMDAKKDNSDAEWEPYMITTNEDGSVSYASQTPSYKYVVVRKGYKHPEIAMKIISVLFDYARYQDDEREEFKRYYQLNVDPTARPLAINVDYSDALTRCYLNIKNALKNPEEVKDMEILEKSFYESCYHYLNDQEESTLEEWAAYVSRITACGLILDCDIKKKEAVFFGKTESMKREWWKLQELERKAYLKMVTGEEPLSYFEEFKSEWYKQGGREITNEVREQIQKKVD